MRIVRGAPGTGKTALVFREFKEALKRGGKPRIVVPTATLVRHFQHELARDGVVCRPGSVISLARLAAELAGGTEAPPPGLMRAIIRAQLDALDLPAFADAARTPGMAEVVEEAIALFEAANCGHEKLSGVRGLSGRARAFVRVWQAVDRELLKTGYSGRLVTFRAAAANAGRMEFWLDGFLHFSPLEAELVQALGKAGRVVLTEGESGDAFLFDEHTTGAPRRPRMTAVPTDSVEREADEIARRIVRMQRTGTPLREIGVALRDAAVYEPVLRGVFERYGIPARFYFAKALAGHPAATFLSGLIDCALNGWEHRAALEALRADPRWGRSAAFDRFDFVVREHMPGKGTTELLVHAQDDYKRRLADCTAIRNWPELALRPGEWANRLQQFAAKLYLPGRMEGPLTFSDVETARNQVAGLRAWTQAVTEVAALWPDARGPVSLAEYWAFAGKAVHEASYRLHDDRRDVVHVLSSYEARQWDVTALFVCGMTNRDYPKRGTQNLLFPDSDIEVLRRAGISLRRASDLEEEEEELWRELSCRARAELVVTWPRHDAGGRTVEASRYVSEPDAREAPVLSIPGGGERNRRGSRGRITADDLLTAIAVSHPQMSVTAIEDLAQCRFKFFAGRTLALRMVPDRPEERIQPKVSGLIMHEALEEWLKVNRQSDFVALFEAAFEKMRQKMHLPAGFKLEVERSFLRRVAEKVSTTEFWTAVKTEAEVPFALVLTPTLTVNGRIDRIDWMNDSDCVIVDYKGGRTKRVESFVHNKAKLQGPLYALAAREILGLRTIAMMYIAVRDDKRFGWGAVPGTDLGLIPIPENWIENGRTLAVERVGELMAGVIEASPTEPGDCRFCDHRDACHVKEDQGELVRVAGAENA